MLWMPYEKHLWLTHKSSKPENAEYGIRDVVDDLVHVRRAWERYQETRDRNAIYGYLRRVFALVRRWKAIGKAGLWAPYALSLQPGRQYHLISDPYAAVIFCTADKRKVDHKTRSKWSRALRYAESAKPKGKKLAEYMQARGGVNKCAAAYARLAQSDK
jgi:hypothetical protein